MPRTAVFIYAEENGSSPVLEWFRELACRDVRAVDACKARIALLGAMGHELRRPHTDLLRNGIWELRARVGRVNYRLLYFFHGKEIAIVAHAFTKEDKIPEIDIERAIERRRRYAQTPEKHRATLDV